MKKQILFFVIVNFLMISVAEAAIEININWESAISEDVAGYEIRVGNTLDNMSVVYTGAVSCSAGVCARTVTETQFPFEVGETYYFSVSSFTNDGTIAPASYSMAYLVISEYAIEEISVSQLFEELTQGTYTMVVGSSGNFTVTPIFDPEDPEPDPPPADGVTINLVDQPWAIGQEPAEISGSEAYLSGVSYTTYSPEHNGNCYFINDVITVSPSNHWMVVPVYMPADTSTYLQFCKNETEWLRWGITPSNQFVHCYTDWPIVGSTVDIEAGTWVIISINLYNLGFQDGDDITGFAFSSIYEGFMFDDPIFTDSTIESDPEDPEPDPPPADGVTINLVDQPWAIGQEPAEISGSEAYLSGVSYTTYSPEHNGNCYFINDVITVSPSNHWMVVPVYMPADTSTYLQFCKNETEWLRWGITPSNQFVHCYTDWPIVGSTVDIEAGTWVIISINLYNLGFQDGDDITGFAFSSIYEGFMFDDPIFTDSAQ